MKPRLLSIVTLAGLLVAPSPVSASGKILTVRLRNGTGGARVPIGTPVRLETMRGTQKLLEQTARTGRHGEAAFTGLSADPGVSFRASVDYREATYTSETLSYSEGENQKVAEVTVYEPMEEPTDLSIAVAHLFLEPDGDHVTVQELLLIQNRGDRNFVGKPVADGAARETLRFTLPGQAFDVEAGTGLMSCCITVRENLIVDSMAVLPGTKEIGFTYRLPVRGGGLELERPVDLPMEQVVLVAEDAELQSLDPNLVPVQPRQAPSDAGQANGSDLPHALSGVQLAAGDVLKVRLAGLVQPPAPVDYLGTLGLLAGGAAMMMLIAASFRYRRRSTPAPTESPQSLAEQIAELDLRFESGQIDATVYETDRAALKTRLVAVLASGARR